MIYKIDLKFQQTFLPNMICLKCTLWFDIYNFLFMIPMLILDILKKLNEKTWPCVESTIYLMWKKLSNIEIFKKKICLCS